MKTYEVMVDNDLFLSPVKEADSFMSRFQGLMLKKSIGEKEGLLLRNCGSIHCCFMRFTIDVVYLNEAFEVLKVETVKPWRIGSIVKGARHVLEVNEHTASHLREGMKLTFREVDNGYSGI